MLRIIVLYALLLSAPLGARADAVDVEIVIAADGSGSIDSDELRLQRDGWASALESPEVLAAIADGMIGRIAIVYVEWGGPTSQHVIVDWHVIGDAASAGLFGTQLRQAPRMARGYNSISAAIDFGVGLVEGNSHEGARRVIDVSGDGPNIGGPPIALSRSNALAKGFTIHALAIRRPGGSIRSVDGRPLERYYADAVIGGPGAFVEIADETRPFAIAAKRKLLQEIAGLQPPRYAGRPMPLPGR
jgi:Protein of unknown function (DUF1194)